MDDRQAYEFYADPAHQVPAGPVNRRVGRRLSATVPVRFPQALIDAVRRLADRDGVTVSSWIRKLVAREVMRRQPPDVTVASNDLVRFEATGWPVPESETIAAPEQRPELECIA